MIWGDINDLCDEQPIHLTAETQIRRERLLII
jgi:hypothetical protein